MVIEWHNVGEYRFGWVARRDSCRFIVLRKRWWKILGQHELVAQGVIEYGLEPRERLTPNLYKLTVVFHVEDAVELDANLKRSMAVRWEEMQRRLRTTAR